MRKNVAGQIIGAQMVLAADGTDFTGQVTVFVTGDNGTRTQGTVDASGAAQGAGKCLNKVGGLYIYTPSQAETNYAHIIFSFTGAAAITASPQLYTKIDSNVIELLGTAHLAPAVAGTPDVNTKTMATDAVSAAAMSAAAANKLADHCRRRTQTLVEASANGDALSLGSEYGLIQQAQESAIVGATGTVKRVDGTTTLGTLTIGTTAGADPIRSVS